MNTPSTMAQPASKVIAFLCAACVAAFLLTSCAAEEVPQAEAPGDNAPSAAPGHNTPSAEAPARPSSPEDDASSQNEPVPVPGEVLRVRITADGLDATITLEDIPAAQAFADLLPLEVDMNDLNSNEKYGYLDTSLPTDANTPALIEAGDVMLYGDNCLVVFYETHDNSAYSYTRLGRVDDPSALASLAAVSSIPVSFEQEG